MTFDMNRRTLLSTAAAVTGTAVMAPLLSACGDGGQTTGGASTKKGLKAALPSFVPNSSLTPDIPSVAGGADIATDPGFLTYPAQQARTVKGVPGKGGHYTAVTPLWGTVPSPGNSFYQAMNKALGIDLTIKPTDGNNYLTIIPTMTSAKKLPDWIQLPAWWNSGFNTGGLAGTQLADLTPYLARDRIKKYPNLAAIPSGAWQAGAWGDKIYGIPSYPSSCVVAGTTFYRRDVLDAKGITAGEITSAADLLALGKELTDAKRGVWAFDDVWTYLFPFWGVPNKWKVEDGKLINKYETPEFLEALDWHYKLAKSGFVHPDALAGQEASGSTRFYSGKVLISGGGTGAWTLTDQQSGSAANKDYRRGAFGIFAADGTSKPSLFLGNSTGVISYLNRRLGKGQIEELLSVADYLAAPYGSAEYTMVNFGVEGVHHTMVKGVPTFTDAGKKYVQPQTYSFLASCPQVISNPGADQVTRDFTAWQAANVKYLYKPVFWNMNISLPASLATADAAQSVEDTIKDCYHGKQKVSDVQAAVAAWKSSGNRLRNWLTTNVLEKYGTGQ
ncbi:MULTISPECIES: Tat pathway signal sequence domain protein [unclassified Streptomyces]|uniref:ABC transporter substrate-binding protein n=1 Tax=unclassified Streptomyces TaxID=2593676 RepID=UPI002E814C50|nr:Tat pathway signal sequence domain protein [Streptomyces sp. NBC_00589]WTI33578.1 Tat pathway signal sequence domain protein [Streptomyces sp. NBC_00775]WUB32750.1 Tat pathway signal sequence domain protein [Streptomyces sp. NBC_00589]